MDILELKALPILTRQVLSHIKDLSQDIVPLSEVISYIKEQETISDSNNHADTTRNKE